MQKAETKASAKIAPLGVYRQIIAPPYRRRASKRVEAPRLNRILRKRISSLSKYFLIISPLYK
jgi:hypothetical protein